MRDYYANATHQMPQPVPGMGVYASYDEFANEKIASLMGRSDKLVHHAIHGMDGAGTALLHPVEEAKGIYARMQGEPTEREPGTSKVLRHAVSAGGEVAGGVRDLFGGAYKKADGPPPRYDTLGPAHNAFAGAFGNALATKFVSDPIDGIHRILKKKIVDDPKAHATFHGVIESDPDLQKHYAQNPGQVDDTFKALRKFGPSMATSPAVVRSFLRQSMMTGGNMDFATIRMLAETEKFIQNGRGQGK